MCGWGLVVVCCGWCHDGLVGCWQGKNRGWRGPGHEVLYGRPSARAEIGIQKPVQISAFSALPESEGWFERGWCNIGWF